MSAKLICKKPFSSFGIEHSQGAEVDPSGWPEGTLARRLEGDFVEYKAASNEPSLTVHPVSEVKTEAEGLFGSGTKKKGK
jgi:hypothetical protein